MRAINADVHPIEKIFAKSRRMETGYPFTPKHEEKLKRKRKIYSHKKIKLPLVNKYHINRGAGALI